MNRILIRTPNWIGDTVMSIPAIKSLKRGIAGAEITAICHNRVREVIELIPEVDYIFSYYSPFKKYLGFDIGVIFPPSFSSAFSMFLSHPRTRIGFERGIGDMFLTKKVLPMKSKSLVENYLDIVRELGIKPKVHIPRIDVLPSTKFNFDAIGLCPGARYGPAKRWPYFSRLAEMLIDDMNLRVFLFGGKDDIPITRSMASKEGVYDFTGRPIRNILPLMKLCLAVISNDTGAAHLSSAVGTPTIVIFGSTSPSWTLPPLNSYPIKHNIPCSPCFKRVCPRGHYKCLRAISPEEIISVLKEKIIQGGNSLPG